jgi:class 3 adenylate cyclase
MRFNARLLAQRKGLKREEISLNAGSVVAFAGHMIDHPTRWAGRSPRFPVDLSLERKVREAIGHEIERLNAKVGYCSAACGSDILFAELMLERGAELHIVLPFDNSDFYTTSVDYGLDSMRGWRRRFEQVLVKTKHLHYATTELYLEDDALFEFGNVFTQGLAIIRAEERSVDAFALVVRDSDSQTRRGGTASFAEKWPRWCHEPVSIDLAALRAEVSTLQASPPQTEIRPNGATAPAKRAGRLERNVKAMLFADVKGFSSIPDDKVPDFFYTFLNQVKRAIVGSKPGPVCRNTWGDGLYLVFDQVADAAGFALQLLDHLEQVNWEKLGLRKRTTVRIGMHAGPVFHRLDPILGKKNVFGNQVNRAARIEPVTTPGCVFVSEHFAAVLAVEAGQATEPNRQFACEYVGIEDLAKGYDRCALYRLTRRS